MSKYVLVIQRIGFSCLHDEVYEDLSVSRIAVMRRYNWMQIESQADEGTYPMRFWISDNISWDCKDHREWRSCTNIISIDERTYDWLKPIFDDELLYTKQGDCNG